MQPVHGERGLLGHGRESNQCLSIYLNLRTLYIALYTISINHGDCVWGLCTRPPSHTQLTVHRAPSPNPQWPHLHLTDI